MADLRSSTVGSTTFGVNYLKNVINQADVGREIIVSVARTSGNGGVTNDVLNSVIGYLTTSHGASGSGDDAFTVAAVGTADGTAFVSGTTETVYLRVQGTGDFTAATADMGIANVTVAKVAVFTPAK